MKEEPIYIGCMTKQMGLWNPSHVARGCVVKQCGTCGTDVHLAPTSQKFLQEKPHAKLICMPCLKKKSSDNEMKFMGVVPGAVNEAIDNIQKNKEEK
jgi:hypothetical protein